MDPEPDNEEAAMPQPVEAETEQVEITAEPGVVEEAPVRDSAELLGGETPFFGWEDIVPRRRSARVPKPTEKMKQLKGLDQALVGILFRW
jgi:hypothetical protein